MKKGLRISVKSGIILLTILVASFTAKALPYTAVNSGNWSNPATWGGLVPPTNNTLDQITIPAGKTVTMDNNCTCNGLLATLTVLGTLNSLSTQTLTLTQCTLLGTGLIDVDKLICNTGVIMLYTGSLVANTMQCSALNLGLSANITAKDQLLCSQGLLSILSGGHLNLGANADIVIGDGLLSLGGTSLGVSGSYNVIYNSTSCVCGDELKSVGLANITVSVSNENTVTLSADLIVNGTLSLNSGYLVCGGHNLTINGDVAVGNGSVACTPASNITVNVSTSGILKFAGTNNACKDFTVNCGQGNQVKIGGSLDVKGALKLNSGTLNFHDCILSLSGLLSGAGSLSGNAGSILNCNTPGGIGAALNFVLGGQMLKDCNLNCGQGSSVLLGTALTVQGVLNLLNGCGCNMNGQTLTLGVAAIIDGTGSLICDGASGLICNCTNGLSSLHLGANAVIGLLDVNCGNGNSVNLNNNLKVVGNLSLTNGLLKLNGHDLTISGNIAANGNGSISATVTSNLLVNCAGSPSGHLNLSTGSILNNCTINMGSVGDIVLGTDLHVGGILSLLNGCISTGNNAVILGVGAIISGGSILSYIKSGDIGHLTVPMTPGGGTVKCPIGTPTTYAPVDCKLNSGSGGGLVDVTVIPDVHSNCLSGDDLSLTLALVDLTWLFHSTDISSPNMDVKPGWMSTSEVNGFNNQSCFVSKYDENTSKWDQISPSACTNDGNGLFSIIRIGLNIFGCISIFDNTTITAVADLTDFRYNITPNPARDYIHISNKNINNEIIDVQIMNINGGVVKSAKYSSEEKDLSLSGLNPGNYIVKINDGFNTEVKKIVKQ